MKIDEIGEVGVVLTEANEPVLTGGDQVIGFRELEYTVYRERFLTKSTLVEARHGWVWQTRVRLLLLDNVWVDLPGGKRGKRYHEVLNEEATDILHKRKRVVLRAQSPDHGRIIVEFRPFGAASRLLAWLRNLLEHRRKREAGTLKSPYDEKAR